ncbi:anti-sigma factor family protein [Ancylobacter mangrovi]|uniref:anti-sigma factor family protein n=1 Tax=Ancylobacter mangrovi TaxID=2972472 RepID=UPI0021616263|nr:anti-sigma factor [Ancylobacter mangrovi]MCS0503236.1 anti-sigma factor [Ancylobacter mangrovi]
MKGPHTPIGEDDLQAYIDGRIAQDRFALVETYLDEQPEVRARLERERRQVEVLREQLRAKFEEPVPARLRVSSIRAGRRRRSRGWMRAAAAAVLIFALGCGSGWVLGRGAPAAPPGSRLAAADAVSQGAMAAYRTYVVEVAHPVEVGAEHEKHLMTWLSKRLGRPLEAPDLSAFGYALMGGRLLPARRGAAAQLMYENAGGERLTLYVQASDGTQTAFRFFRDGDASTLAWLDQGFGFAVTAPLARNALLPIAEAIYHAFEPAGPASGNG